MIGAGGRAPRGTHDVDCQNERARLRHAALLELETTEALLDTSGLPDDLDFALGLFHGTMLSLPLWGLLLTLWYLLTSHAGYS
jgi:hypothetical protein